MDPDVGGLVPAARPVAAAAVAVYLRHTEPWFVGLVAHGSAVKGGVVEGSSDLDLLLYLSDGAFDGPALRWDLARAIQRDLAAVDPAPFAYVQGAAVRANATDGLGPVPGAWWLLAGRCPRAPATADEVRRHARETLAFTRRALERVPAALLECGDDRLARQVRLLATDVWPTVYALATLDADDPLAVWALPKDRAVAALGEPHRTRAAAFHRLLIAYHAGGRTMDAALAVLEAGLALVRGATEAPAHG